MAELEKLLCTDSKVESLKKINAIIENGGYSINDKITNCITEIPQRIKLELADGVLTLKAGSQVIVPNGFEEDGTTLKFDYVDIPSDKIPNISAGSISLKYAYVIQDNVYSRYFNTTQCFSGATAPTGGSYLLWYDTTNNLIKESQDGGATWLDRKYCFPVCLFSANGNQFTSIDQVFNGFGYIGSTVWADKGVKGLIPNGRNADGTLKTIEFVTNKVLVYTDIYERINQNLVLNTSFFGPQVNYSFDVENNYSYNGSNITQYCQVGYITQTATNITDFQPKLPFRAVDYNELQSLLPAGSIISSASSTSPTGFLICNGSAASRTTYAKLFSAIGTTYGAGNGSTTFNLPNYTNYQFVTSTNVSVKGTGLALGLTNGNGLTGAFVSRSNDAIMCAYTEGYNTTAGTKVSSAKIYNGSGSGTQTIGVTTDASKSGITGSVSTATLKWYIKY